MRRSDRTRSWVHQLKWNISYQFTAHGAQVEFDAGHVRNNETSSFVAFSDHSRRCQIDFIVLTRRNICENSEVNQIGQH